MVTISDVAAHAGVGVSTVSRVLNNSTAVSPTTRTRVLRSIEDLHYRPNPLAQGLSRGRSQTLGVVVPFFTHASAVERLRGVVAAFEGSRYDLVLFNVETAQHRDEHFALLTRRDRADGLLVLSLAPSPEDLARFAASGMPVVLVDAQGDGVASVVTDDVDGGRIATRHLVSLGHRRVAFLGEHPRNELGSSSSARREAGYCQILDEAGIGHDPGLVAYGPHDRSAAQRRTEELLARQDAPTAIFASSDVQALGVLAAARAAGLRVPEDLSVVGFDDVEISAYVGLTTVRQPLFDSGYAGARLLLDALEQSEPPAPASHELPLELVERSTTARPRRRRR